MEGVYQRLAFGRGAFEHRVFRWLSGHSGRDGEPLLGANRVVAERSTLP